jgi:hypothetical protein
VITIRRARLYADEPLSQVDHHELQPEVNDAIGIAINPYEVTVHSFTPELATALQSFYKSTNGLVVKSVQVEVAPTTADPNLSPGAAPHRLCRRPGVRTTAPPAGGVRPGVAGTANPGND